MHQYANAISVNESPGGARLRSGVRDEERNPPTMDLPDGLLDLLRGPSPCFIATTDPDGAPQLTQTWVDTDGAHVLINSVQGFRKVENLRRDPRVALNIADPANPARYYGLRGRVVGMTTEGAAEHIEALSMRYLGKPYPRFGGSERDRVLITIVVDKVNSP